METKQTTIIVIGAGYAGLLATVRLAGKLRNRAGKSPVEITLVSASDTYVERLRLHQFATSRPVKSRSIAQVLSGTGVKFVQGHVTGLDLSGRTVSVQTETGPVQLQYDRLVYALGSVTDRDRVPGVREYAYTLSIEGSRSVSQLRDRLQALDISGGTLMVCGGGPTGIESAAEFATAYPRIHIRLVTTGAFGRLWGDEGPGRQTPPTGETAAEYMRKSLLKLGVSVHEQTTITEVGAAEIETDKGTIAYDLCLWAGGFVAPPLARQAGLAVNELGQILVDPFLRSISHPDVTAVGDSAHPVEEPGVKLRMCAASAVVMGAHGADCLAAELRGRTPKPLSFAYQGQCIALGPHNAIGFSNYPDDIPRRPFFTGRAGYRVRETVLGYLSSLPLMERRWPGSYIWVGKGRYSVALRKRQKLEAATADNPDSHNQEGNQARKIA